ncbi:MAG: helix-turn-helix transcriptional regulator [Oscillospiraceae bacterium]|nr:helix-turn-helix transcriptional regulator [Oscillospiraceae bacterium]
MYDLGLRLKQVRMQRGMTQKSLARQINKSVSAVSSYESNAQMPPLDVLVSIAAVLRVSLDFLVGFDCGGVYASKNLTMPQKELLDLLFAEFVSPSDPGTGLSSAQVNILQKMILLFLTEAKS